MYGFFNHFGGTLNFFEVHNFCEFLKTHFGRCENQLSAILEKIETSPIGVVMPLNYQFRRRTHRKEIQVTIVQMNFFLKSQTPTTIPPPLIKFEHSICFSDQCGFPSRHIIMYNSVILIDCPINQHISALFLPCILALINHIKVCYFGFSPFSMKKCKNATEQKPMGLRGTC